MRITETHGNSRNGIKGSRISVYTAPLPSHPKGMLIDRFVVPTRHAIAYCLRHPGGIYGERFAEGVAVAGDGNPYENMIGAAVLSVEGAA